MIYVMKDVMHSKKKAHFIKNVGYFNPNKLLKVGFWELKCEEKQEREIMDDFGFLILADWLMNCSLDSPSN